MVTSKDWKCPTLRGWNSRAVALQWEEAGSWDDGGWGAEPGKRFLLLLLQTARRADPTATAVEPGRSTIGKLASRGKTGGMMRYAESATGMRKLRFRREGLSRTARRMSPRR